MYTVRIKRGIRNGNENENSEKKKIFFIVSKAIKLHY
jgi:hypothetical protein